jgi:hypothetical protein
MCTSPNPINGATFCFPLAGLTAGTNIQSVSVAELICEWEAWGQKRKTATSHCPCAPVWDTCFPLLVCPSVRHLLPTVPVPQCETPASHCTCVPAWDTCFPLSLCPSVRHPLLTVRVSQRETPASHCPCAPVWDTCFSLYVCPSVRHLLPTVHVPQCETPASHCSCVPAWDTCFSLFVCPSVRHLLPTVPVLYNWRQLQSYCRKSSTRRFFKNVPFHKLTNAVQKSL